MKSLLTLISKVAKCHCILKLFKLFKKESPLFGM